MLIVKNLLGETEALADVSQAEVLEQVGGNFTLSFAVPNSNGNIHAYHLLEEESIIETEDGHEFRIKSMVENRLGKSGTAQHIFFDLIDAYVYDMIGGTKTVEELLTFVLNGTGWTFTVEGVVNPKNVFNVGENNPLALLKGVLSEFELEYEIQPNKHLVIKEQIGLDNDNQFRYKHNTKSLKRSVDTSKLATVIRGYGANGLVVEYQSPNLTLYGTRHAEPVRDDRYTIAESLLERCRMELQDNPDVSIELEAIQLDFECGLGDPVWLIYEPMGIEFQTRVMELKRNPLKKAKTAITLSNVKATIASQLTQVRQEMQVNAKQTRSRIDQTDEKITLEVERLDGDIQDAYSQIDISAGEVLIESKGYTDQREAVINSSISVLSDGINLKAEKTYVDTQLGTVNSEIDGLDGRVASAESNISIQAGQISQKVSTSDFNGNTIASLINQTSTTIDIIAEKLNLVGAVSVLSDITGNLGTINAGTINGVNINGGTMSGTVWTSSGTGTPFDCRVGGFDSMKVYHGSLRLIQNGSEYCVINNSGVFINGQLVGAGTAKWG